jgi:hypothetical protein
MLASDILDLTFFPIGMILMMDGSWTDGRGGWYICDGRDTPHGKTPNLADRFIRGGASAGSTGGGSAILSEANLPSHNHSLSGLTISGGEHLHGVGTLSASSGSATHSHGIGTLAVTVNDGGIHGHTINDSGHSHKLRYYSGTTDSNSGNDTNNRSNGVYMYSSNRAGVDTSTTGISIASNTGSHGHTVTVSGSTATDGAAHTHGISGSTASTGHSHEISGGAIGNTGSGTAFDVTPAYYTMIYIKKMV